MESLPFDLVHAIFLLVEPHALQQKFRLAAVSRHLRNVALASPLVWTSFCISSYRNAVLLPLLLARSGDALLCLELDFTSFANGPPVPTGTQRKVVRLVAQHFARMRELVLRYDSNTSLSDVAPLLNKGLVYRELRQMAVFGTLPTLEMDLSAPNLRLLQLQYAVPRDWDGVLSATLEVLHLKFMGDAWMLLRVFDRARHLRELALETRTQADPVIFDSIALNPPRELRTLALDMPYAERDALAILRALANASVVPQKSTIYMSTGRDSLLVEHIVAQLFRGLDTLVSLDALEASSSSSFTVTDAAGSTRTAAFWDTTYVNPGWDWPALWTRFPALHTVRRISFHTDIWNTIAPSASLWPALDELQITASMTQVYSHCQYRSANDWSRFQLVCAQIGRIRVDVEPPEGVDFELAQTILRVVQRITINRVKAVEVCVGTTRFGPDAETHVLNVNQWLRDPVSRLSPGRYRLCRHCKIPFQSPRPYSQAELYLLQAFG